MAIKGLKIIGETINASVPKTARLFEARDLDGIVELARFQEDMGAAYIDVNIGTGEPKFMAEVVKILQEHVSAPLSIDSPDAEIMRAGLEAYDPAKAKGRIPLVNSIAETRPEIFDLYAIRPFRAILIASERRDESGRHPNKTAGDILETARRLAQIGRRVHAMANDDLFIDPGIAPVGADSEGITKEVLGAIRLIRQDPELSGVHFCVGLSNFSAMLPARRPDGSPVKVALENAFLSLAVPLGLDHIIGNVAKEYRLLPAEDPAYRAVVEAMEKGGFDSLMRIRRFYQGDPE